MTRQEVFNSIEAEREYQKRKWGIEFDNENTPNDWVTYITKYLGLAVTMPFDAVQFRTQILKVAALATAVLEQETFAPRHYDVNRAVEGRIG